MLLSPRRHGPFTCRPYSGLGALESPRPGGGCPRQNPTRREFFMPQSHRMLRARLSVLGGLLGVSALVVGFAVPAGAATVPAANNLIIGVGSNTTYFMMTQLSDLFNESPGCDLVVASGTQNDNY